MAVPRGVLPLRDLRSTQRVRRMRGTGGPRGTPRIDGERADARAKGCGHARTGDPRGTPRIDGERADARAKGDSMLGAIITLLLVAAAAYAVTQVGGVITLLFIAAVLFLAYRRLLLLAFTATFTVLLIAYTLLGEWSAPAGICKGVLWVLMAFLWLLNVRPFRKAVITRSFMNAYPKLLPSLS